LFFDRIWIAIVFAGIGVFVDWVVAVGSASL
jgi:hypothetical protein